MDQTHTRKGGISIPEVYNEACLWLCSGVPMDIYIIKNGAIASYLQDAYFDSQLPIMPPDVDFVELTWKAEAETVNIQSCLMLY